MAATWIVRGHESRRRWGRRVDSPQRRVAATRTFRGDEHRRYRLGWDYPLHLGVTEAGEGEDGRMKSAIGIGTLLGDGLGDTIRVSLTEDPEFESRPARSLRASRGGAAAATAEATARSRRESGGTS